DAVVRGNAGDAAAGVCGRRALVQTGNRCPVVRIPGRGTHVEQLLGRQLAVKDVATDQAVLLLPLERPDDLPRDHRFAEARGELVVAVDDAVGVRLQLFAVRLLRP